MTERRAERMRWTDVEAYLKHDDRVMLAIGAVEQHGAHCAMGTDTMIADAVARGAAERTGVIVYPPLWYGWSDMHMGFEGTVSLRPSTMQAVIVDFVESLTRAGFKRFLLLNGNRRVNLPPMQIAASELTNAGGRIVAVADVAYLAYDKLAALRRSPPGGIGHAGEMETSVMIHIHGDCVWMPEAVSKPTHPADPQRVFMSSDPAFDGGNRFYLPRTAEQFRAGSGGTGVSGDPTYANAETGKAAYEAMVDGLVQVLDILKEAPLPPKRQEGSSGS